MSAWLRKFVLCVWRGRRSVVLKVYNDEEKCKAEAENLGKLSKLGISIPSVVNQEGKYLVLKPRAQHFSKEERKNRFFKKEHAVLLYSILQKTHTAGWVHRDVRPPNFFLHDKKVLLNDWAGAV
eukprot:TRINITY_DN666_c2_g1_i1.p1 TRINITY_DN666_c2_g1~~TRINITY_DN666_c2_g1_i1.p1  ORF type:complete len:139 (-),score=13.08 TRINITY_DN666_c2_g1_i1:139-510(-)